MPKLTAKQQYWSEHLLRADAFDGSLAAYAKTQSISAKTLYRWRSYFRHTTTTTSEAKTMFTQVVNTSMPDAGIKLTLGNIQLHFMRLPDPQWLAALISASDSQ